MSQLTLITISRNNATSAVTEDQTERHQTNMLVQSRFAETLTLTLNPNFGESERHQHVDTVFSCCYTLMARRYIAVACFFRSLFFARQPYNPSTAVSFFKRRTVSTASQLR